MKIKLLISVIFICISGLIFSQVKIVEPILEDQYSPYHYFGDLPSGFKSIKIRNYYPLISGEIDSNSTLIEYYTDGKINSVFNETTFKKETSSYIYFKNGFWSKIKNKTFFKNSNFESVDSINRKIIYDSLDRIKEINYSYDYDIKYSYNSQSLIDTIFYGDKKTSCYWYDNKKRVIKNLQYGSESDHQIFSYQYLHSKILLKHQMMNTYNGITDTTNTNSITIFNSDTLEINQTISFIDYHKNLKLNTITWDYKQGKLFSKSEKFSQNDFIEITYYSYNESGFLIEERKENSKTGKILFQSFYEYVSF